MNESKWIEVIPLKFGHDNATRLILYLSASKLCIVYFYFIWLSASSHTDQIIFDQLLYWGNSKIHKCGTNLNE